MGGILGDLIKKTKKVFFYLFLLKNICHYLNYKQTFSYSIINTDIWENPMNRKELVEAILKSKELSHLTKKDADAFINYMLDTIKKSVKKGDDVSLVGFGTFTKVKRAARTGVNPATGEKIKIKAKTLPKFRPGKAWKEMF